MITALVALLGAALGYCIGYDRGFRSVPPSKTRCADSVVTVADRELWIAAPTDEAAAEILINYRR
jgi:hypothetical protein